MTPEHRRGEPGYWIALECWGRGLATEASAAVLELGFATLGLNRPRAMHFTRNPASGRVMLKLGMRFEGIHRQYLVKNSRLEDVARYALLREDWAGPGAIVRRSS
ncbi:MAG TPA: GNAT family protein [Gemmatimonadaceae bacterium]|nr:GNAT family protein [Gemmatimonadaceae bacterium]